MPEFNDLLILMVVVWTVGKLFRFMKLPVVFGELVGGIIVGPTILGIVHPDSEVIKVIAELGIFFLMLHAGLETDPEELFKASKKSLLVSLGGFLVPFLGGLAVAHSFGQTLEASLFIAIGLSISAIALITRLFKDCKIHKTELAHLSMGAAVIQDIIALVLFSLVLNLAETGTVQLIPLSIFLLKIIGFFLVIIVGGMKTAKYMNRLIYFGNKAFTLTLIIALLMGLIAEAIGLHMIIGAFLAGLFIKEEVIDERVFDKIEDRVYGLAYGFFGPVFFASLAFHLDFSALTVAPTFFATILVVAILGKIIGSGIPAHWMGFKKVEAWIIGLAMNNRGAVELIIASIGLEKGIIDGTVFSILVLMAFGTTLFSILTTPPLAKQLTVAAESGK